MTVDVRTDTTLSELARTLLAEHNGIVPAAEALMGLAEADAELFKRLTAHALRDACLMTIRRVTSLERCGAWAGASRPQAAPAERSADVTAWAGAVARTLMDDFRLPGGQALGDATRDDLVAGAQVFTERAIDMASKAAWLNLIAQGLPSGKTVRQKYTEARLQNLQASVMKSTQEAA